MEKVESLNNEIKELKQQIMKQSNKDSNRNRRNSVRGVFGDSSYPSLAEALQRSSGTKSTSARTPAALAVTTSRTVTTENSKTKT